jgi:murein DD-endopeptidase MepM/ murein hydrolase activator NlpD
MGEGKVAVAILCLLVLLMACVGGGFFLYIGVTAMAVQEQAPQIPPEMEAAYRQVAAQTGVNWALLAAWDGAVNGYNLPIPPVGDIYARKEQAELDRRRQEAEAWCRDHPEEIKRCPPAPPELTPQDEQVLWRSAYAEWNNRLKQYIVTHAAAMAPYTAELDHETEPVFQRFMTAVEAARAADWVEGYLVLDSMESDDDAILVTPIDPPPNWVPVDGFAWPAEGSITSRFGIRVSPIDGQRRLHAGIDLGIDTGTPVRATKAGRVVTAEFSEVYGLMVVIDHGGGYSSLYAHNSALAVRVGQEVIQGQLISESGTTGWSTGPHLHFEIHFQGVPIDPLLVLSERMR